MNNPPFPYTVIIKRKPKNENPFGQEPPDEEIYNGVCDFANNRFPITKKGVLVGKYNMYIPFNNIIFNKLDIIELTLRDKKVMGEIVDYNPTNFGTTIMWDNVSN